MKRIFLIALILLFALPMPRVSLAACDCSFDVSRTPTTDSSGGAPDVGLVVHDPGTTPGDFVLCAIRYDNFSHGVQPPDSTWADLIDLQLPDGSGVSLFQQFYPGSYATALFQNDSGLSAENWSSACTAQSYRSAIDGIVTAASGAASSSAIAPAVMITQTLDELVNVFAAAGATTISSPSFGSIVSQQNSFAPSIGIVTSTNPIVSPTSTNNVHLSTAQVNGGISAALKCGQPPTPVATATATATATGTSGATPTATATPAVQINHIVVILMENHSFDNLFGTFPGARGTTSATLHTGGSYALTHAPNQYATDMGHTYGNALTDENGGAMNGFDLVGGCLSTDSPPYQCLSQYHQSDKPNLWTLAQDFALGDNFFQSMNGPSLPNHMFTLAASSFNINSNGNQVGTTDSWGCDAPLKASDCTAANVPSLQCTGVGTCPSCAGVTTSAFVSRLGLSSIYPCLTQPSILDEMNTAAITWKYYGIIAKGTSGYYWTTPNIFIDSTNGTANWTSHVVSDSTFDADASSGNLPQVSFITTASGWSFHAPAPLCTGENYVVDKLNAIAAGGSTQWNHTIVVLTWDEWGGTYDHVAPPVIDGLGLGIRVPILVISPYSLAGNVIHTQGSFESIVKQIEETYGLPSLGNRDVTATDLSAYLDYTQSPISSSVFSAANMPQRPLSGQPVVCQPASSAP